MNIRTAIAALFAIVSTTSVFCANAGAQDLDRYLERQRDLAALSGIFGEMHHLRRTCELRLEADVWRERMKKLIALEEPQTNEREELVAKFNEGFRNVQRRFPSCDRRARDYAAARAAQGDEIVRRLRTQLLETKDDSVEGFVLPNGTSPSSD